MAIARLVVVLASVLAVLGLARGDAQCARHGRRPRPHSVTITEFGAVGDGVTVNTLPFQNAIFYLRSFADKGGAQLYVPKGRWLTGSFNLTSHLTLFLEKDAVIVGTKVVNPNDWPSHFISMSILQCCRMDRMFSHSNSFPFASAPRA